MIDYDGFKNFMKEKAKQENGQPFSQSAISSYPTTLQLGMNVLKSIPEYTDRDALWILRDYLTKRRTRFCIFTARISRKTSHRS